MLLMVIDTLDFIERRHRVPRLRDDPGHLPYPKWRLLVPMMILLKFGGYRSSSCRRPTDRQKIEYTSRTSSYRRPGHNMIELVTATPPASPASTLLGASRRVDARCDLVTSVSCASPRRRRRGAAVLGRRGAQPHPAWTAALHTLRASLQRARGQVSRFWFSM